MVDRAIARSTSSAVQLVYCPRLPQQPRNFHNRSKVPGVWAKGKKPGEGSLRPGSGQARKLKKAGKRASAKAPSETAHA